MRLLITGGAGFIGSNLARMALGAGHEVVILDNLSTGYRENVEDIDVTFVEGSLLDEDAVKKAVDGVDSVVHLAALGSVPRSIKDPVTSHHMNATGTLLLLEASRAAGVGHFLVSSSSSVYGLNPALPKNERQWIRPISPYAVTKLAQEQYTLAYQQSYGMNTLAFRFFNVYGPRQMPGHVYAAVIPVWFDALIKGEPLWVNGDGLHSRDFTFVETVAGVLLDAATRQVGHPEPVNLAFGSNTTLLDLIAEMEKVSGLKADVRHRDPRPGDLKASMADNSSLMGLFPDVQATPLTEGLTKTFEWLSARS